MTLKIYDTDLNIIEYENVELFKFNSDLSMIQIKGKDYNIYIPLHMIKYIKETF